MARSFLVKQADDLLDAEYTAKWRDRQALDPLTRRVLGTILEQFIASGGPVNVDALVTLLPEQTHAEMTRAMAQLDEKDMILVEDARVMLAYPFSSAPTVFTVLLADGRERYAVCAIDALGIAAMLGQPVTIRSRCHHCREPLEIDVRPNGPIGGADIMVWVGERGDVRKKACASFCMTLNFFRSEEHLRSWWEAHPDVPGAAAVLDEAFTLGAKVFGKLLHDIPSDVAVPETPPLLVGKNAGGGAPPAF